MNMHLYPKLAWHGIIKNKKTYVPFLLTSIGLVMMHRVLSHLQQIRQTDAWRR